MQVVESGTQSSAVFLLPRESKPFSSTKTSSTLSSHTNPLNHSPHHHTPHHHQYQFNNRHAGLSPRSPRSILHPFHRPHHHLFRSKAPHLIFNPISSSEINILSHYYRAAIPTKVKAPTREPLLRPKADLLCNISIALLTDDTISALVTPIP